ncbi:MAG TPA: RloB family protein [Methylocella sp.]|nr:RloB family protein [Methylocella sp.]
MSGSRRFRSLRRQVETKAPKPKIVIYSEGEKTERDYFEEMRRAFHSVVVDIEIIEGAGVPLTIAKEVAQAAQLARRWDRRQSYTTRDEFWAVFDRDEHPNVPEAISRCEDAKVHVAFSDPCFELWLILHFKDFDRPDHRHDVQQHLETLCGDYDHAKRKTTDCRKLMKFVAEAEQRAERQWHRRKDEGDPPRRPFTTVYALTRRIRDG